MANLPEQTINVEVTPNPNEQPPIVYVSQGDVFRSFKVMLVNDGAAWSPMSGATFEIVGKKRDKNIFQYEISAALVSDNELTINTLEQMTAVSGPVVCEIRIHNADDVYGTSNFIMFVEGSATDGPDSASTLDAVTRAEAAAAKAEEVAEQIHDISQEVEQAHQYALQAQSAASSASIDAQAAETSATHAQEYAGNAANYAQDARNQVTYAQNAASDASSYAQAAAQSASNASAHATDSQTYAGQASQSATAAAGSATNAASDATNAATAATQAQTAATQAQRYARPTAVETLIMAQDWDASTHKVTISDSSITLLAHVTVTVPEGELMTESQWLANNVALANACIYPYSQASGSITLYALNVPTTNVYVRLIISGGGVS